MLTLSPLNYNVIKCLSAELIDFLIQNSDIRGLPGGRLSVPPAVKGLKIKCDINQQYLKTVDLHFVKSE